MERGNGREMRKEVEERGRVRGGGKGEEEKGKENIRLSQFERGSHSFIILRIATLA